MISYHYGNRSNTLEESTGRIVVRIRKNAILKAVQLAIKMKKNK